MQQEIFDAIQAALKELGVEDANFTVERPSDFSHGDYATNVALVVANQLGKNPKEVAETLKEKLDRKIDGVEKIEIAGPGFLNFFLSAEKIQEVVVKAASDDSWGTNILQNDRTIMVEYTQPNPFKEFHIGHLMSNALGESLARALEMSGAKVVRANYQGDVGPHVAKAMHVLLEQGHAQPTLAEISAAYVEGSQRYEEDEKEKAAIDQLNKLIYQQYDEVTDANVWALYQYGRTVTLQHFEELYKMLGTKFDFYFFESETSARGLALVRSHMGTFEESEGAIIFRGENYGLHTRVFINRLGLPTYETKDLGLAELKKERANFDLSITTTAKEQDDYFKVVFKALELTHPEWAGQFKHVSHGMMRFSEGKMSSRRGNVITGESLLRDLKAVAKEKMGERELKDADKTAEEVAVGAIKYAVLRQGRGSDIVFDPEQSLSLEGDSGPYLQYARVRALSLLLKAEAAGLQARGRTWPSGPERTESAGQPLERLLLHFPEVVMRAAKELEPHYVTTYLTELASTFNSWYVTDEARVIGGKNSSYALLLATATENVLKNGLTILGIPAPEEM